VIIAAGGGAFQPNRPPLAGIEELENESVFYRVSNVETFRKQARWSSLVAATAL